MTLPGPKPDYQWHVYDSRKNEVAGHVECTYNEQTECWSEPRFVEEPYLRVHGLAPGLNYGQQVYEGLQARRTSDNEILIFRPAVHAARINRSAAAVSLPAVPEALFLACVHAAVAQNAAYVPPHDFAGSLYIRPLLFGAGAQIGLDASDETLFCVFVQPHMAFHGAGALRALVAEDFDRAATRGTGAVKVGGNYAPVMRWTREARRDGWGVLLHLDSRTQTYIDEFSTSSFIGIREGPPRDGTPAPPTVVVAHSAAAIESVTADCVAQLARSFGWAVERRLVRLSELSTFSEVLAAGTAAGLVPCSVVYHKSTDTKLEFLVGGPRHRKLMDTLKGVQRGEIGDTFGWCETLRYDEFCAPGATDHPVVGGQR